MKGRKHSNTALLNTDRTFQGRDMTLSIAAALTNSRGPVLATEGLGAATNPPC